MENASKALLIAATILIAIVLVAILVRVVNSTTGTKEQVEVTMSSTDIAVHNNNFMQYAGENKTLADVKALVDGIISNNSTTQNGVYLQINNVNGYSYTNKTNFKGMIEAIGKIPNDIRYKITPQINNSTSLINIMRIEKMN